MQRVQEKKRPRGLANKALIDITGQTFERLTVTSFAGTDHVNHARWNVRCVCGKEKVVTGKSLRAGAIRSCGCLRKDNNQGRRFQKGEALRLKHGHCRRSTGPGRSPRTTEYQAWAGMKSRCYNPRNKKFSDYGGRGIAVCERWRNDFEAFLADVGLKPSPKHSMDRIDPNGNYEPSNCRWATIGEQMINKRLSAPRVAAIIDAMTAASSDILERAVLARVRRELLGA